MRKLLLELQTCEYDDEGARIEKNKTTTEKQFKKLVRRGHLAAAHSDSIITAECDGSERRGANFS